MASRVWWRAAGRCGRLTCRSARTCGLGWRGAVWGGSMRRSRMGWGGGFCLIRLLMGRGGVGGGDDVEREDEMGMRWKLGVRALVFWGLDLAWKGALSSQGSWICFACNGGAFLSRWRLDWIFQFGDAYHSESALGVSLRKISDNKIRGIALLFHSFGLASKRPADI
jgi:hypothetical protein